MVMHPVCWCETSFFGKAARVFEGACLHSEGKTALVAVRQGGGRRLHVHLLHPHCFQHLPPPPTQSNTSHIPLSHHGQHGTCSSNNRSDRVSPLSPCEVASSGTVLTSGAALVAQHTPQACRLPRMKHPLVSGGGGGCRSYV